MPANDRTAESGGKDQLNVGLISGIEWRTVENRINRESKDWSTWWRKDEDSEEKKHWKEQAGDTLPPGNYNLDTGETDIDAAQTTVENIFDDITEYHIIRTRTRACSKEIQRGNYSFTVIIRTHEPTPVSELPDSPRIHSGFY